MYYIRTYVYIVQVLTVYRYGICSNITVVGIGTYNISDHPGPDYDNITAIVRRKYALLL